VASIIDGIDFNPALYFLADTAAKNARDMIG